MERPNIILINCDDLGYGDLGCYGSEFNNTPAINNLAKKGMKFTNFYMASPVCSPSRGAMMTGCYPPRIGFGEFDNRSVLFPGQGVGLNTGEKTIAALLKQENYKTMIIGKWHCGDQPEFLPTRHGFDNYYGLPYSNDMGRQAHGVECPPLPLMDDEEVIEEQPDQSSLTERYVERAIRFLRDNKDNAFFLYFAHMHVHLPHYTPERFMKQSKNGQHGASVECIDWSTAVLVHELERLGIMDNTIIIFTSDNGSNKRLGGSNGDLKGRKGTTWEGGMRVPCIIYWKNKIEADKDCDEIVSSIDFYTTLANIAGAKVPDDRIIDSLDIGDLLFGKTDKSPRGTFVYYKQNNLEAIRHKEYKLHFRKNEDKIKELYNLNEDIGETDNIYNENPDIVAQLTELANKYREDIGDESLGIKGKNIRPKGVCDNPDTLTHYDPNHPYIIAMYDKTETG